MIIPAAYPMFVIDREKDKIAGAVVAWVVQTAPDGYDVFEDFPRVEMALTDRGTQISTTDNRFYFRASAR